MIYKNGKKTKNNRNIDNEKEIDEQRDKESNATLSYWGAVKCYLILFSENKPICTELIFGKWPARYACL